MPPNVLLIISHDTGRHLGCYGVPTVQTPHLDRLAEQGCRFTQHFACSAYCSPSRGALFTGRYPQTNGLQGLCHGVYGWRFNPGERHLSHLLHDVGYSTALIGHQHETQDIDTDLCFDLHSHHANPVTWDQPPCGPVADAACAFLREPARHDRPFYLQLGFFETHDPLDFGGARPDRAKGVSVPPHLVDNAPAQQRMAAFQGNLHGMDAAIGRVLAALDESGLARNTLVLYTTDHGLALPRAKTTLYDPGVEVALLARLPDRIAENTTCDWLSSHVDVVPTVLDILGFPVPSNVQGRSLVGAFRGGSPVREEVYTMIVRHGGLSEHRAVRTARHKLIWNFEPRPRQVAPVDFAHPVEHGFVPIVELYDLVDDPLEFRNLADAPECAALRNDLQARLHHWLVSVDDDILRHPTAMPYYRRAVSSISNNIKEHP